MANTPQDNKQYQDYVGSHLNRAQGYPQAAFGPNTAFGVTNAMPMDWRGYGQAMYNGGQYYGFPTAQAPAMYTQPLGMAHMAYPATAAAPVIPQSTEENDSEWADYMQQLGHVADYIPQAAPIRPVQGMYTFPTIFLTPNGQTQAYAPVPGMAAVPMPAPSHELQQQQMEEEIHRVTGRVSHLGVAPVPPQQKPVQILSREQPHVHSPAPIPAPTREQLAPSSVPAPAPAVVAPRTQHAETPVMAIPAPATPTPVSNGKAPAAPTTTTTTTSPATPQASAPQAAAAPSPASAGGGGGGKKMSFADALKAKKAAPPTPAPAMAPAVVPTVLQRPATSGSGTTVALPSASASMPKTVMAPKPVPISSSSARPAPAVKAKLPNPIDHYNPRTFEVNPRTARFFVIKSYSEDDVHKSIKYNVWASTQTGNKRLDTAYRESSERGPIYLFFSVNGSGQFHGMARMSSPVDFNKTLSYWAADKWTGCFSVDWIFIKDIPNTQFLKIINPQNENKPVTKSRDTQEVPIEPGRDMLRIFRDFRHRSCLLDDFEHYDQKEEVLQETRKSQTSEAPAAAPYVSSASPELKSSPSAAGASSAAANDEGDPSKFNPPRFARITKTR